MICSVETCERASKTLGMCSLHYQRYAKHGDPLYTMNAPRDLSLEDHLRWKGWDENANGCWIYRGATDSWGYGILNHKKKMLGAHRVAYQVWVGEIPEGLVVRHTCDNPPCINPEHLELGTYADNSRDRDKRARSGSAKLTVDQVLEIRHLRETTKMTLQELGDAFGLTKDGVGCIVYRKTWKNV